MRDRNQDFLALVRDGLQHREGLTAACPTLVGIVPKMGRRLDKENLPTIDSYPRSRRINTQLSEQVQICKL